MMLPLRWLRPLGAGQAFLSTPVIGILAVGSAAAAPLGPGLHRPVSQPATSVAPLANGVVNGRVVDAKSAPLPGVTVVVEGTTLGATTNEEGVFSIPNVPTGQHTLVYSSVGFSTARVSVTVLDGKPVQAPLTTLGENAQALSEAVVVGYGTQRRQDVTGSITTIDSKQFVKGQVTNPEQLVQGKVAGVQITTAGGAPGAGSQIIIRGGSSLSASNRPLFVIDGVPVTNDGLAGAGNPLSLINPNDIESITVLKDASATAIYGVRASNGVIIVTTKKGLAGEAVRVNVSTQHSIATVAKYVPVLTGDQFRDLVLNYGNYQQQALLGTENTDWQRAIYRPAYTADNNASVLGALGKVPFRVSVGYLTQQGLLQRNDLKRYTGNLSLTPVLLNGNLRVELNLKGSWIDNNFSDQSAVGTAVGFDPSQPITSDDPRYAPFGGYYEFLQGNGQLVNLSARNPLSLINQRRDRSTVKRSLGNVRLDYKLPFVPGLSANLNVGYDVQRGTGTVYVAPSSASQYNRQGINNQYRQDLDNYLLEAYAKYEGQVLGQRLELLGGYSFQKFGNTNYIFDDRRADGSVYTPLTQTYDNQTQYTNNLVLLSYYSRLNYNIADKYLFTGTFRIDQTSNFAPGRRTGYFPSGAFAWRLKGEDFLKNNATVSDLKLRLGYGQTGQQDIGINSGYLPISTLSTNTAQQLVGGQYYRTLRPSFYNPELTWETTTTYNVGLDYGFFDGRLTGAVEVYRRDTKNLLFFSNVSALSNLSNAGFLNIGSLTNQGVELTANLDVLRSEKLNVSVNGNATFNRNRITKLTLVDDANYVGQINGSQINAVGAPAGSFYVYKQLYNGEGQPIQNAVADLVSDGVLNGSDRYIGKSPRPTTILGFGANATYGKLNLAFTLRSNLGGYVFNGVRSGAYFAPSTNGTLGNLSTEILASRLANFNSLTAQSDYFLENASFTRLENVTLGYQFGSVLGKNSTLNLTAAAQNLFVLTKYSGLDPEISSGYDNNIYPRPRTFTLGLTYGF
jgi:TonB-linked SusC/RagA family outer membrane protein